MICRTCNKDLHESAFQFVKNKSGGGSHRLECQDCRKEKTRAASKSWYSKNAEAHKANCTNRRRDNAPPVRKCNLCGTLRPRAEFASVAPICDLCRA